MSKTNFTGDQCAFIDRLNQRLATWLDDHPGPPELTAAMRYSLLAGGKRIRPLLVQAAGRLFGADDAALLAPAIAVECIHTYSLIHDDLPAMDDDDLRRGRPTLHLAYDEASAILAGDALQAAAFGWLGGTDARWPAAGRAAEAVVILAAAAGAEGMVGGQVLDMELTGQTPTPEAIERMFALKTGALISASIRLGALAAAESTAADLAGLDRFAQAIGVAFQIHDDLLDLEGSTAELGKPQGSDLVQEKANYAHCHGTEHARARVQALHEEALGVLEPYGARAAGLRRLADYIVLRRF